MRSWKVGSGVGVVNQGDAGQFMLVSRVYAMLSDDKSSSMYERGLREGVWEGCAGRMGV